jgi:hypothetical protein
MSNPLDRHPALESLRANLDVATTKGQEAGIPRDQIVRAMLLSANELCRVAIAVGEKMESIKGLLPIVPPKRRRFFRRGIH